MQLRLHLSVQLLQMEWAVEPAWAVGDDAASPTVAALLQQWVHEGLLAA